MTTAKDFGPAMWVPELNQLQRAIDLGYFVAAQLTVHLDVEHESDQHGSYLDVGIQRLTDGLPVDARIVRDAGDGDGCVEFTGTPGNLATVLSRYDDDGRIVNSPKPGWEYTDDSY